MAVCFIERLDSIFELMKLAELMRHSWEDKSYRAANRLFAIYHDSFLGAFDVNVVIDVSHLVF
jgi:hypothetical protein